MPVARSPASLTSARGPSNVNTRLRAASQSSNGHEEEQEGDETALPDLQERISTPHCDAPRTLDDIQRQSNIVKNAIIQFGPDGLLRVDGTNYQDWTQELGEAALTILSNKDFYTKDLPDHPLQILARALLLASIAPSLRRDFLTLTNCYDIYVQIKARFQSSGWAAQLHAFSALHRVPCDLNSNLPQLAAHYKSLYARFIDSGIALTKDNLLALLLQSSIAPGSEFRNEFDHRLDNELAGNSHRPFSFDRYITILSSCQLRVNNKNSDRHTPLPAMYSSAPSPAPETDSEMISANATRPNFPG
ncbi:hypothetical protein PSTG_16237 [Puccinia striiformis f. sp. tritici PST-78]|uniref:Uncharacterized protein n=1 Tax=Puccinia striiformis f. sp. tritici PST-78 TaxID=1165861 RepID=A0A0L0UTG1_9BASI|nr:hypothetical protein PSTG_16237 [Puccinia striiformis f. sp. tritici PST-78]